MIHNTRNKVLDRPIVVGQSNMLTPKLDCEPQRLDLTVPFASGPARSGVSFPAVPVQLAETGEWIMDSLLR